MDQNRVIADAAGPLIEGNDFFRLAADALPSGVLVVGADGRIALSNRELERQFGYADKELIGQPVDLLVPDVLQAVHAAHREGYRRSPEMPPMGGDRELVARRRDGSTFLVEVTLNPVRTDRAPYVLAVVADVTTRRENERARRAAVDGQLGFERLIAQLSVEFINLPGDQVDESIREALQRIGETLHVERCAFFRFEPDGRMVRPVSWQKAGTPPLPPVVPGEESLPWTLGRLRAGSLIAISSVDEIPDPADRETYRRVGIRASVGVPLLVGGQVLGAVGFSMLTSERAWEQETVQRLKDVASAFANVLARKQGEEALNSALAEVKRLSDQLEAENLYLRREVQERMGVGLIVGQSAAIGAVLEQVAQVAATDSTVLLLGETGTGKELFAAQIHNQSARRDRAMVRVNCSAIPSTLIESELFGREKGAYTGALARQAGRFELADRSTIFLDEIGELPPEVQVKLLRVLEERRFERLGSPKSIAVDTRIIAATHRDLEQRIASGAFREDLFYRLNVFPICVPPLRERVEDIPLLVWRFVDEFSKAFGKPIEAIPRETMTALQQYSWPGNIRELRNIVERAMIIASGPRLTVALPAPTAASTKRSSKLMDVEKEHIRAVLESAGWRIRGGGGAAERLGLKPTTLETRMAKLGLRRPKPA